MLYIAIARVETRCPISEIPSNINIIGDRHRFKDQTVFVNTNTNIRQSNRISRKQTTAGTTTASATSAASICTASTYIDVPIIIAVIEAGIIGITLTVS